LTRIYENRGKYYAEYIQHHNRDSQKLNVTQDEVLGPVNLQNGIFGRDLTTLLSRTPKARGLG
jgi:hypothetical protein